MKGLVVLAVPMAMSLVGGLAQAQETRDYWQRPTNSSYGGSECFNPGEGGGSGGGGGGSKNCERVCKTVCKIVAFTACLRVLPHNSTPAIFRSTRLRMRLWTSRMRFTRATRLQKDRASIR